MTFKWTPEVTEIASAAWRRGDTSRSIAETIGAPSRNSVIGKMLRLGIRRPESVGVINSRAAIKARPRPKPVHYPTGFKLTRPDERKLPTIPLPTPEEEMRASKVLADLCAHECKWPVGLVEPGHGELQKFCAVPVVGVAPYCPKHCRLATDRTTKRRSVEDLLKFASKLAA